jgi:hypothetical protein
MIQRITHLFLILDFTVVIAMGSGELKENYYPSVSRSLTSDFSSPIIQYVNPNEALPHHWYGAAVYVSDDRAIAGASGDGDYSKYGNAYVLQKNRKNQWIEIAKLTSTNPGLDDGFGTAVSIYLGYAFVGASRYCSFPFPPDYSSLLLQR